MKKIFLKVFSLSICLLFFCNVFLLPCYAVEPTNTLKFKNGKFKILVLSDLQDTNNPRKGTITLARNAIEKTNPDLIVLLGDNIAGWWKKVNKTETKEAVDKFAKMIDDKNIPFALVFGNHDHEGLCDDKNGMTEEEAKKQLLKWYQQYDSCIAVAGEEMTGFCNYNKTIKDSKGEKDVFNLWFMDSNPYTPEEEGGGYGYVHEDQTKWYIETSNKLKAENDGKPLPSILFQHIIVPEAYEMFDVADRSTKGAVKGHGIKSDNYYVPNSKFIYQGELNEGPCSPDVNHGQFDSWLEQGDVIAAFFGHDHVNSFAGKYKGIDLVACPGVTYYSYGNNHGVRTILLSERNLTTFSSEIYTFEDIAGEEVENIIIRNHGFITYIDVFLPIIISSVVGIVLIAVLLDVIIKHRKKR